jgi:cellulose synthase/poly-beta-1,6-N-acetylglucosamine synthase-like glycosyltransferase
MALLIFVEIAFCLAALVMLVPALVFGIQVLMALPTYLPRAMTDGRRPAVAVVVPAHDEALGIARTIRSVATQMTDKDRLIVVADNCTDATAAIAKAEGAEVVERTDALYRGKGYALEFGVRHLEDNPPDIVVIIDADCVVGSGAIEHLARLGVAMRCPVQSLNLMCSPDGAGLKTRIAEFAWLVKTHVRALGFHRLGLPCQLMGTGMAFPWKIIQKTSLGTGHIVEDLKLGIDMARAGVPTRFCPEALITSNFPLTTEGVSSQRMRWEHGHLGVILGIAPSFIWEALRRRDRMQLALALDLCVPPLSLLLLLVLSIFVGSGLLFLVTGVLFPWYFSCIPLYIIILSVLAAWVRYGRQVISLTDLMRVPFYIAWKIPLYLKFLFRRQTEWVRSKRDGN